MFIQLFTLDSKTAYSILSHDDYTICWYFQDSSKLSDIDIIITSH